MQWCCKYETTISRCSKQVTLFVPELCERCLEEKTWLIDPQKAESVYRWKEELGIEPGMPKGEALDKFCGWRESKKTCQRCGEKKYSQFCPIRTICKESEEVIEDVVRDDNGTRVNETDEFKSIRAEILKGRERDAVRATE